MTGTRGTTQPGQRLAPSERNIHYKAKQVELERARRQKLKEINRQNKERNKENENQRNTSNQRGEEQRAKTSGRKRLSDVLESNDDEEEGNIFGVSVPVEGQQSDQCNDEIPKEVVIYWLRRRRLKENRIAILTTTGLRKLCKHNHRMRMMQTMMQD